MARQLPWLWSARHLFRKVTVVAAGVALCAGLAATGTAATVTGAIPVTGAASPAQADTFYPAYLAYPAAGNAAGPALVSLARQAAVIRPLHRASLLVEVRLSAERAAAAKAAASRAARARAAAARVRLERAAAAAAARAEVRREIARRMLPTGLQREAVRRAVTVESETPTGSPQEIASEMLAQRGWTGQFSCLDSLWGHESGWNIHAENPSTGAYGIPQALPGSQLASAGPDWQSSAATQIRWGLNYISNRYGSPCGAWDHEEASGWY